MDEAAPQAAEGMSREEILKALELLLMFWGDVYDIGHDDERGWWASRRGVIGHILIAADPAELGRMLGDDFGPGQ
jgi:hypothetical protein